MDKKLVAVFVACIFVAAAMHVSEAEDYMGAYKSCFEKCRRDCSDEGNGSTFCEMKCDSDCLAKEAEAKLHINAN